MKWKYFLILFLSYSCQNKEKDIVKEDYLSISDVRQYLPPSYFNGAKLIYTDSVGNEKLLYTKATEKLVALSDNGFEYQAETFKIVLSDPNNPSFQIVLLGNTNYSPTGNLSIYLNGILMPGNPMGSTTATIGFSNGEPIVAMWDDFREHVIFNGKSYNDVYITIGKNGLERKESYSEIDLNSELGVVAFCDEKNTLWNLDRIEQ